MISECSMHACYGVSAACRPAETLPAWRNRGNSQVKFSIRINDPMMFVRGLFRLTMSLYNWSYFRTPGNKRKSWKFLVTARSEVGHNPDSGTHMRWILRCMHAIQLRPAETRRRRDESGEFPGECSWVVYDGRERVNYLFNLYSERNIMI